MDRLPIDARQELTPAGPAALGARLGRLGNLSGPVPSTCDIAVLWESRTITIALSLVARGRLGPSSIAEGALP